ncbi:A-type_flavoprotein [Hexamita inflata]|uniref:A-type_flavoprotein n=1 Tax=Hexamita inflata TaxID=28002 RepID=A0ABP1GJR0_9EUKA
MFQSLNGSVEQVAQIIANGTTNCVKIHDLQVSDFTKCALSCYDSEFLAFGSPTVYEQMTPLVEGAIQYLKGLHLIKGRKVILFGSFCWLDKAVNQMKKMIEQAGGVVVAEITFKMAVDYKTTQQILESLKLLV